MIIFDIETRPKPIDELKRVVADFDPAEVKTGNLKDQAKITAKIEESRKSYWTDVQDKAALSAETGQVAAIGYMTDSGKMILHMDHESPEDEILRAFWSNWSKASQSNRRLIGFNSNRFDIPFLARRSWCIGVEVPANVFQPSGYIAPTSIDLLDRWQCGDRRSSVSLDRVCKACAIGAKPDGVNGALFYKLFDDVKTREQAIDYLKNDLAMTRALAERLGIL